MATIYIPVMIWIVGAGICYVVAKKRELKLTPLWDIAFCLFGPLAIPFVFLVKSEAG
ncbi:MAG: hypothetical protein K6L75_10765 [Cellvibrionaceae bacterium]